MNAPARLCDLRCTHAECAEFREQVALTLRDVFGIHMMGEHRAEAEKTCVDCGSAFPCSHKSTTATRCRSCLKEYNRVRKANERRRREERESHMSRAPLPFKVSSTGFSLSVELTDALRSESARLTAAAGKHVSMSRIAEQAIRRYLGMEEAR